MQQLMLLQITDAMFALPIKSKNSSSMDLKDFRSGGYKKQYQYKSFIPSLVDKDWGISDSGLISLLSQADRTLGELNAFSELIPDVDFFIMMPVGKEATSSVELKARKRILTKCYKKKNILILTNVMIVKK